MKINKLKINAFGKIKNKEINLNDKINIIYGENESGKSTILKFIINSFYGTSKNKKGKETSDYDQYKPWDTDEFSGKLEYKLDNGEMFEIYREFGKKNPIIFNKDFEDISKKFNIDKNKGNQFFYEQTKIDEDLFLATSAILQEEIRLDKNTQNILIQKMTNIVGTGSDNISYKRAIERLNKKQLEEVGTERSKEKPINILEQKIKKLQDEKQELIQYENLKYKIELEKEQILKEISSNKIKYEIIKQIKNIIMKEKIQKEKIEINEKIKDENIQKINKIKNEIIEIQNQENKKIKNYNQEINKQKNKLKKISNIIFIFLILLNILWYIVLNKNIENKIIKYSFIIIIPIFMILSYFYKKIISNKLSKNIQNKNLEKNNIINNLNNEIEILQKNIEEIEKQIKINKKEINDKINEEKEKIKNNYFEIMNNYEFNNLFNINIEIEEEKIKEKINDEEIQLYKLDIESSNIEEKYNKLVNIDETLYKLEEEYKEITKLNSSINMVRQIIIEAYEEMQRTISPKLTEQLSNTISEITNGKYKKVKFNDEQGMIVEIENGNYISAERLSSGTIDQLYLSLRLAMIDNMLVENIPIIIDEAFSHFDDIRLKNILKFLNGNFKNQQIIIFTCNDREKDTLNDLNIEYNLITL